MKQKQPKRFDLAATPDGFRLSYNNPGPMTGEQRYNVILTVIWATVIVAVVSIIATTFR